MPPTIGTTMSLRSRRMNGNAIFRSEKNAGDRVWCDPAEPSCASLIARTIPSLDSQSDVPDLVCWATGDRRRPVPLRRAGVCFRRARLCRSTLRWRKARTTSMRRWFAFYPAVPCPPLQHSPSSNNDSSTHGDVQQRELEYFEQRVRYEEGIVSADASGGSSPFEPLCPLLLHSGCALLGRTLQRVVPVQSGVHAEPLDRV